MNPSVAAAAAVALAAALPWVAGDAAVNWGLLVLLQVTVAQSWNLLGGYGGQVNLGHAAFFGIGALVTRGLWVQGTPVVGALVAGSAAAAVAGLVVGLPSLRLRGPYFAIGTLAMAEILRIVVGTTLPEVSALPSDLITGYRLVPRYYLALALAVLSTAVVWRVSCSRFGMGLVAIREDEWVAETVGVDTYRHKLAALLLSAALAGAAGGAFGYYHLSFYPQFVFSPVWTFDAVLMVFLGGIGTVWGPPVGATFFVLLREALALRLTELHVLVFGAVFVVVVLTLPGGLVDVARVLRAMRVRRPQPA
ncbi:MAG: branched-chain amino acid ABC transporter permease [Armatimonadota bacterium]|nr:branched-chain amino acid ABC transporter permease [Armatimonadota bacterium]MDW8156154.1 branched-chain amino acid ABC transporter permease [Armatimonadota bacterium]